MFDFQACAVTCSICASCISHRTDDVSLGLIASNWTLILVSFGFAPLTSFWWPFFSFHWVKNTCHHHHCRAQPLLFGRRTGRSPSLPSPPLSIANWTALNCALSLSFIRSPRHYHCTPVHTFGSNRRRLLTIEAHACDEQFTREKKSNSCNHVVRQLSLFRLKFNFIKILFISGFDVLRSFFRHHLNLTIGPKNFFFFFFNLSFLTGRFHLNWFHFPSHPVNFSLSRPSFNCFLRCALTFRQVGHVPVSTSIGRSGPHPNSNVYFDSARASFHSKGLSPEIELISIDFLSFDLLINLVLTLSPF